VVLQNATPLASALAIVLPLLAFLLVGWLVRARGIQLPDRVHWLLTRRFVPVAAGVISALLTWYVWGSLDEPGTIHDEQAYLLQARIFAEGRWTGAAPPLPEFFEQAHVFVEPRVAAKYPPGNSLLMVPGVWLGMPGLMTVVFAGVAGGLLFALARRFTDPTVALVAWALWSTATVGLFCRASYVSQNLSAALWLGALWALARWRERGRGADLALLSGALGWLFLTRPLTAAALAAPIGVVVLAGTVRHGRWGQLGIVAGLAAATIGLTLMWHDRTLGDWRVSPYAEYSRQYVPFDKPGFGVDPTPPRRQPPPEIVWVGQSRLAFHAAHQPSALPLILVQRLTGLGQALGETWRGFLVVLFVLGAFRAAGAVRFAVLSGLLLLAAYLVYAHPSVWVIYYAEIFPVFFVVAALELGWIAGTALKLAPRARQAAMMLALVLMAPAMAIDVMAARRFHDESAAFPRAAAEAVAQIPESRAVVFLRYPPDHEHHWSLNVNAPDPRTARVWLVNDRGPANARLLAQTDRAAYVLNVGAWTLERIR
jgi:hypothetical protein